MCVDFWLWTEKSQGGFVQAPILLVNVLDHAYYSFWEWDLSLSATDPPALLLEKVIYSPALLLEKVIYSPALLLEKVIYSPALLLEKVIYSPALLLEKVIYSPALLLEKVIYSPALLLEKVIYSPALLLEKVIDSHYAFVGFIEGACPNLIGIIRIV